MPQDPHDPNSVNAIVGRRLRLKREMTGLSQAKLGQRMGVSRLKIGQFESGQTAVPAPLLYKLSQLFEVDIRYFFCADEQAPALDDLDDIDPILNKLSISLLRDLDALDDSDVRKSLAAVMERVAILRQDKPMQS